MHNEEEDINEEDFIKNTNKYIDNECFLKRLKAYQVCKLLDKITLTSSQYSTLFFNLSKYFGKIDLLMILSHAHTTEFKNKSDAKEVSDTISSVLGINTLQSLFSYFKEISDDIKIEVNIRKSSSDHIPISISLDSTILDLKQQIKAKLSVDPDRQILFYNDTLLENENSLNFYRLHNGATLDLLRLDNFPSLTPSQSGDNSLPRVSLEIRVNRESTTIPNIDISIRGIELKYIIQKTKGISVSQQRLIFDGTYIDNGSSLMSHGINNGSIIYVVDYI